MPVPVMSLAQMRDWECATWATGQTEAEVIRRVGHAVAQWALRLTRQGEFILILAGKGHNGDDARAAHLHLAANRVVELLDISSPAHDLEKLTAAFARRPALIVDGLFGIGLNRSLDQNWINLINSINVAGIPVLSVDVPSGLHAGTGEPMGAAIAASITLTVGAPKSGLLRPSAWPFVGRLAVATDIGLVPHSVSGDLLWTLPRDFIGYPPARSIAAHKGEFGHVAIVAGSFGFHGAAVLSARGAQCAQPGLITVLTHERSYFPVAAQLQAVMVNVLDNNLRLPADFSAVLIGPGLASPDLPDELKTLVRRLWRDSPQPVIVDASALDWLSAGQVVSRNAIRVMTPHPGEAARLLRSTPQRVQEDRVSALRELSSRFGNCYVVLKGHQTLVGRANGEIHVNPSGNPHLAQGGSGDALAGFIAGLLAQPALQSDAARTICYAVWQHGAAADELTFARNNWVVEDLFHQLGNIKAEAANW